MATREYSLEKGRSDYLTPESIYRPILRFIGVESFWIDVCCSDYNIPSFLYITSRCFYHVDREGYVYPQFNESGPVDGSTYDWHGHCWMNPPYDQLGKWIKKAYEESQNSAEVWCIFPNRTETAYFHKYILNNPNCFRVILQKNKDLGFLHPETKEFMGQYKNPLCICYFGKNAKEYAKRWSVEQPIKGCVAIGV